MTTVPPNPKPRYKCAVEDCDVRDRGKLIEYRAKREEWLGWYELNKDEPNSIQQQIFAMILIDLGYRTLAEARRNEKADARVAARSGLLSHLLDQGYVANQVLAIRRLLDRAGDVISLRRLLDDIHRNNNLLTREVYVCHNGLPYDSEAWQKLPQGFEEKMWGIQAPGFANYLRSHVRHEMFDRLSAVLASQRNRNDVISEGIFNTLDEWLTASPATQFIKLSHKFFAHAADLSSRGSLDYSGIKLADVTEIHRVITRVERAITDHILFIAEGRDVVPLAPLGLLKDLDTPYAPPEGIANMQSRWEELTEERNKWPLGIIDELCPRELLPPG